MDKLLKNNELKKNKKCQQLVSSFPNFSSEGLKKEGPFIGKDFDKLEIWLHKFSELELGDYNYIENIQSITNKEIEHLTRDEILTKLTAYIRGDRFSFGSLDSSIKDGTLEKLITILKERTK